LWFWGLNQIKSKQIVKVKKERTQRKNARKKLANKASMSDDDGIGTVHRMNE
jgi:hypothetical protein